MKKVYSIVLALLLCLCCVAFAEEGDLRATFEGMSIEELEEARDTLDKVLNEKIIGNAHLTFAQDAYEIELNKTVSVKPGCEGRTINNKTKLEYATSDPSIAAVSATGTVTGKGAGTAIITVTATFEDDGVLTGSVAVNVIVPVTAVKVPTAKVTAVKGQTLDVASLVSVTPANATEQGLSYSVSDESIATIDANGILTPVKGGTVKVTVKSLEETKTPKSASFSVTVTEPAGSVTLSETQCTVGKGKTVTVKATVGPDSATNKKVTWASADPKVAKVSATGTITGVANGTTEITATAADGSGVCATVRVTVITSVTGVRFSKQTETALMGYTLDLSPLATITPNDATEQKVSYTVSDESVATVDANGILTPVKGGKVKVTATSCEDTSQPKSATITVTVTEPVGSVTLSDDEITVAKGKTYTVTATVGPDSATNKKVTWTSENTKIATVSATGAIRGVATGTTTITVTAADGSGCRDSVKVTVIQGVTGVTIKGSGETKKEVTLTKGGTYSLSASIAPNDATNKQVRWSSSSSYVCDVDENGKLTAKNKGTCVITATAKDGSGKQATVTVYVEPTLPVSVEGIYWQTTWGFKNGKMGVKVTSNCVHRSIKSFDYTVECTGYYGTNTSNLSYSGSAIYPGRTVKSRLTTSVVGGFTSAYKVTITVTRVYFSDGSSYTIPTDSRQPVSFAM